MSAKKEADGKPAAVHPRRQTHDRRLSHIVGHPLDAVSLRLEIGDDAASLPAPSAATDSSAVSQYQHGGDSPNGTGSLGSPGSTRSAGSPGTGLTPGLITPLFVSERGNLVEASRSGESSNTGHAPHLSSLNTPTLSAQAAARSAQIFSHRELEQELGFSAAQNLTINELRERYYVGPIDSGKLLVMQVIDSWEDTAVTNYFRTGRPFIYAVKCQFRGYEWTRTVRRPQLLAMHLAMKSKYTYIRTRNGMTRNLSPEKKAFFDEYLGKNFHYPKELKLNHRYTSAQRMAGLQLYLDSLCHCPLVLNHEAFCEYFRISNFSFNIRYGESLREERIEMRVTQAGLARERHTSSVDCCCFVCFCVSKPCACNIKKCTAKGNSRWAILKPGCLIFADSALSPTDRPSEVVTFDATLRVHHGALQTGSALKLIVTTSEVTLELGFKSKKKASFWARSIGLAKSNSEWVIGHANGSFAPVRPAFGSLLSGEPSQIMSAALPCVDGLDYFGKLHTAICAAEHEIFITDWWMHPFTFLKRPAKKYPCSRLDRLLKSRAKAGVRVYILLWHELELAVPHNSFFTSRYLHELHPNILVMRYPNHFGSKGVRYWSHHDKMVVIDQQVAFIGGLDLTYGRWDTFEHHLFDHEDEAVIDIVRGGNAESDRTDIATKTPSIDIGMGKDEPVSGVDSGVIEQAREGVTFGKHTSPHVEEYRECIDDAGMHGGGNFPSRDYYNCRVKDFEDITNWEDSIDRTKVPRMPWHDVHCMIVGESARDVGRHFIHRWNFTLAAKGSARRPLIPTIATPWMWQYALRNPSQKSENAARLAQRISVSFRGPSSSMMPSPLPSESNQASQSAGERKTPEPGGSTARVSSSAIHRFDTIASNLSSVESEINTVNKLNTKVRFISMLRSNTSQSMFSNARSSENGEVSESRERNTNVGRLGSNKERNDRAGAVDSDKKGPAGGVNSFLEQQRNLPQDMMGVFEMGFGDEDKDPDHQRFMQFDEDEKHFVELQKLHRKKKKKRKKKKNSDTNSAIGADVGLQSNSGSLHRNGAQRKNRQSDMHAIQRVLRKDKEQYKSNARISDPDGSGGNDVADREHKRGNVIYHGIKLVDFQQLVPTQRASATFHKMGSSASKTPTKDDDDREFLTDETVPLLSRVVRVLPAAIATECQIVRSLGEWSGGLHENSIHTAYRRLIRNSERYILIENQFFISGMSGDQRIKNRIIEEIFQRIVRAHVEQPNRFKVYIFIPLLPSAEGEIDHSPVIRACMYWQFQTLSRGKRSLFNLLREAGIKPEEYVSVFGLRAWDLTPGTRVPVSELIYIHSKAMVVDDEWAIVGSANINDRSLVGNRDSEIAVVMHDTAQFVEIDLVDGTKLNVGKLGYELRTRLLQEHCGIPSSNIHLFDDLGSDAVFNRINNIAESNSLIFGKVFGCVPNNEVHSFSELRKYRMKLAKMDAVKGTRDGDREIKKDGGVTRENASVPTNLEEKHLLPADAASKLGASKSSSSSLLNSKNFGDGKTTSCSKKRTNSTSTSKTFQRITTNRQIVPDCYRAPPGADDPDVMEQLRKIQGHIVKYPLEFFRDEDAASLLPHIGEKEFLVKQHFFT